MSSFVESVVRVKMRHASKEHSKGHTHTHQFIMVVSTYMLSEVLNRRRERHISLKERAAATFHHFWRPVSFEGVEEQIVQYSTHQDLWYTWVSSLPPTEPIHRGAVRHAEHRVRGRVGGGRGQTGYAARLLQPPARHPHHLQDDQGLFIMGLFFVCTVMGVNELSSPMSLTGYFIQILPFFY